MKVFYWIAASFFCIGIISCTGTKINSSVKEKGYRLPQGTILVMGIVTEKDKSLRLKTESSITLQLDSIGYHAMLAMHVFGPQSFYKMEDKKLQEYFIKSGADAVMTVQLLTNLDTLEYIQDVVSFTPDTIHTFSGKYIETNYRKRITPGYYKTSPEYQWQIKIYKMPSGQVVYTARTTLQKLLSVKEMADKNASLIVQFLLKKGILISQHE